MLDRDSHGRFLPLEYAEYLEDEVDDWKDFHEVVRDKREGIKYEYSKGKVCKELYDGVINFNKKQVEVVERFDWLGRLKVNVSTAFIVLVLLIIIAALLKAVIGGS